MKPLTWDEIVEHCSRLHTTRRRRMFPEEFFPEQTEMREDSAMLDIIADGTEATIVPTRMHEPGFYVRSRNGADYWAWGSDGQLDTFRRMVDDGRVFADSAPGVVS